MTDTNYRIDALQYARWSEKIFRQMREGEMDAVHVTIAYHENFREMVHNIEQWNLWFERFPDLIFQGKTGDDVRRARETGRTAIFFGFQNPSPIEDDIGLVEICHQLGIRFMQLSYNNQSLLATGCYEDEDPGITRMGREVIREMNRVGLVVDMSHSADRSTLEAIDLSDRPIAITHANPKFWHPALRNKSDRVLDALAAEGGLLGCSLYPFHLPGGADCSRARFCQMLCRLVDRLGIEHVGLGSDLCLGWGYDKLAWMRNGRWAKTTDHGEDDSGTPAWPDQPPWFTGLAGFREIDEGLVQEGMSRGEIDRIMGLNWKAFLNEGLAPEAA